MIMYEKPDDLTGTKKKGGKKREKQKERKTETIKNIK